LELYIPLDEYMNSYKTKQDALFHALRDAIINGKLKANWQLPSSRRMAEHYGLSRGTVNTVYDMLLAQSYVYTKGGSGTFVCELQPTADRELISDECTLQLSHWGQRVLQQYKEGTAEQASVWKNKHMDDSAHMPLESIEFTLGKVELNQFPIKDWNRCLYEQARQQYELELIDAYSSEGHTELRRCIAKHLRSHRGILVQSEDIMIVNGSQQAITLLVQMLMNEGDCAVMEDPHYVGARLAIQSVGGVVHTYPVDEQGICFYPQQQNCKLMFLTPSRQFPTGAVLSLERRLELLRWAERSNAFIIEDDYDSEFRYAGRAIEPLKSLDKGGRVIYIGTFSKTMLQDIRIGYAILPKQLREAFQSAKRVYERHPISIIQQRALAAFMASGHYDRHLRRLKRLYRKRAELMHQLLTEHLHEVLEPCPTQAGLHIYAIWKKDEHQFEAFLHACNGYAVKAVDARIYQMNVKQPALCLGYAHLNEEQIAEGIYRLRLAWESVQHHRLDY